jgi:SAM-dependent MidA family methyltransferase
VSPDATLAERLARAITLGGPISIAQFMATANTAYYASRDPLGAKGDFITAPEISQMFGELIGLWCADLWLRWAEGLRDPPPKLPAYLELGPGRGTLAADALRAMARFDLAPHVHFVENSPALRKAQIAAVPGAKVYDSYKDVPTNTPLLMVANEFFDALPVHQVVKGEDGGAGQGSDDPQDRGKASGGWHQRLVACQDTLFLPIAGKRVPDDIIPPDLRAAPLGSIIETSPLSVIYVEALAARIRAQGGAMLIIDYGYEGPAVGDTLQAVRAHQYANPFEAVGEQDITAHVDFATLAAAGERAGLRASTLVGQGAWLAALGIGPRAEALVVASPDRAHEVHAAHQRLTAPDQMGTLFKVLALSAPDWPEPAGFAP